MVSIFAGTRGYADEVPVDQVQNWEADLLRHVESSHGELLREIREKKAISREMEASLEEMILNFNRGWVPE